MSKTPKQCCGICDFTRGDNDQTHKQCTYQVQLPHKYSETEERRDA